VVQSRCGLGFALKAAESLGIFSYFIGQELQSNETVELQVLGLVNHTHPAATQLLENAVMRDDLAEQIGRHSNLRAVMLGWMRGQVNGAIYASAVISDMHNFGHFRISWMGEVTVVCSTRACARTRKSCRPGVGCLIVTGGLVAGSEALCCIQQWPARGHQRSSHC